MNKKKTIKILMEEIMDIETYSVRKTPSVKLERTHKKAVLPSYAKLGDAGADVRSVTRTVIQPGARMLLDLGFKIEVEDGWEIQVRSRSGLALKKGITVLNSPGTIDCGYRGQCGVILQNNSKKPFPVRVGDRVAQFVLKRAPQASFAWTDKVSPSERGEGGFGSTGTK